jgi:hypothetical protein
MNKSRNKQIPMQNPPKRSIVEKWERKKNSRTEQRKDKGRNRDGIFATFVRTPRLKKTLFVSSFVPSHEMISARMQQVIDHTQTVTKHGRNILQQWAAARGNHCCTCNAPYAWHSTCSHRTSRDQSRHSERMAGHTPECGGRTGAASEVRTEQCTVAEQSRRPASTVVAGLRSPRVRLSSSRGCWGHCEEPMAGSTRRQQG